MPIVVTYDPLAGHADRVLAPASAGRTLTLRRLGPALQPQLPDVRPRDRIALVAVPRAAPSRARWRASSLERLPRAPGDGAAPGSRASARRAFMRHPDPEHVPYQMSPYSELLGAGPGALPGRGARRALPREGAGARRRGGRQAARLPRLDPHARGRRGRRAHRREARPGPLLDRDGHLRLGGGPGSRGRPRPTGWPGRPSTPTPRSGTGTRRRGDGAQRGCRPSSAPSRATRSASSPAATRWPSTRATSTCWSRSSCRTCASAATLQGRDALRAFFAESLAAIGVSILFVGNHLVDFETREQRARRRLLPRPDPGRRRAGSSRRSSIATPTSGATAPGCSRGATTCSGTASKRGCGRWSRPPRTGRAATSAAAPCPRPGPPGARSGSSGSARPTATQERELARDREDVTRLGLVLAPLLERAQALVHELGGEAAHVEAVERAA